MKTIILKSTLKGQLPEITKYFAVIMMCFLALGYVNTYLNEQMVKYHASSTWEMIFNLGAGLEVFYVALLKIFILVLMGIYAWICVSTLVYDSRKQVILKLDNAGKISSIRSEEVGFLWSKKSEEMPCNRVLSLTSSYSILGKFTGTGDISINFVSFANADTDEVVCSIKGVEDREELVKKIDDAVPGYEGMLLVVKSR